MQYTALTRKLIALRETSLQEIREYCRPRAATLSLSYQQQGRIHILSMVVNALANVTGEMLPDQAQQAAQPLLEMLAARKAARLAFSHRHPRSYRADHTTEWQIKGELEQIDLIWPSLCACFSPRWQAQPWKHGCHFQVYHYLPERACADTEAITRWKGAYRHSWFEKVAILKVPAFNTLDQRLEEVFRMTNHIEENWTLGQAILWFQGDTPPRSTSRRDVVVSVLSERAWMVDRVGFRPLAFGEVGGRR